VTGVTEDRTRIEAKDNNSFWVGIRVGTETSMERIGI
jgi:hypothetical protein